MISDLSKKYTVKFATIVHDGDPVAQAIVAATTGKTTVVLSYVITGTVDGTAQWKSATTAISGAMHVQADGGCRIDSGGHHPRGCLKTASGEALNLVSSGIALAGHITYVQF